MILRQLQVITTHLHVLNILMPKFGIYFSNVAIQIVKGLIFTKGLPRPFWDDKGVALHSNRCLSPSPMVGATKHHPFQ
jgi:hypothetical protein